MNNIQKQIDKSVEEIMKNSTEIYIGSQSDLAINTTHAVSIVKKSQLDLIEVIKGEIELNPARFQAEEIALESKDLSFMEGYDRAIKDMLDLLTNLK